MIICSADILRLHLKDAELKQEYLLCGLISACSPAGGTPGIWMGPFSGALLCSSQ